MPRAGLSPVALVDIALAVIDASGGEPLTIGAVAARAGVQPPSVYKHIAGLPELVALVGSRIYADLGDALEMAVGDRTGVDAARQFLHTYRSFAVLHPARYRALPVRPIGHPLLEETGARVILIAERAVAHRHGDDRIHALRTMRAAAHGFATLETAGGFGLDVDVDASFDRLVEQVVADAR